MTKKAEKVISTPLQTILKVSTVYENVSLQDLTNEKRESYIGEPEYVVKNESEKELSSWYYETKRVITYEDGTSEEWEQKDVGTSKKFKNAKLELTEYVVIEKDKNASQLEVIVKDFKKGNEFGIFTINLNSK